MGALGLCGLSNSSRLRRERTDSRGCRVAPATDKLVVATARISTDWKHGELARRRDGWWQGAPG